MRHQRSRRLVSVRNAPVPLGRQSAAAARISAPQNQSRAPMGEACMGPPNTGDNDREAAEDTAKLPRRLASPMYVSRRESGGTFKSDPLAALFIQPKDYVRLRQKALMRWRLNDCAQHLLNYTQAQPIAKAHSNTAVKLNTADLPKSAEVSEWLSKIGPIASSEGGSFVVGFCMKEGPAEQLQMAE